MSLWLTPGLKQSTSPQVLFHGSGKQVSIVMCFYLSTTSYTVIAIYQTVCWIIHFICQQLKLRSPLWFLWRISPHLQTSPIPYWKPAFWHRWMTKTSDCVEFTSLYNPGLMIRNLPTWMRMMNMVRWSRHTKENFYGNCSSHTTNPSQNLVLVL